MEHSLIPCIFFEQLSEVFWRFAPRKYLTAMRIRNNDSPNKTIAHNRHEASFLPFAGTSKFDFAKPILLGSTIQNRGIRHLKNKVVSSRSNDDHLSSHWIGLLQPANSTSPKQVGTPSTQMFSTLKGVSRV